MGAAKTANRLGASSSGRALPLPEVAGIGYMAVVVMIIAASAEAAAGAGRPAHDHRVRMPVQARQLRADGGAGGFRYRRRALALMHDGWRRDRAAGDAHDADLPSPAGAVGRRSWRAWHCERQRAIVRHGQNLCRDIGRHQHYRGKPGAEPAEPPPAGNAHAAPPATADRLPGDGRRSGSCTHVVRVSLSSSPAGCQASARSCRRYWPASELACILRRLINLVALRNVSIRPMHRACQPYPARLEPWDATSPGFLDGTHRFKCPGAPRPRASPAVPRAKSPLSGRPVS